MLTPEPVIDESPTGVKKISLVVADDHQLFIDGVTLILKDEQNFEIVAQALNGQEVIDALRTRAIDVVLLDINMPETKITQVIGEIQKRFPQTKIIILTMDVSLVNYMKLLEYGIDGYMCKTEDKVQFVKAIQKVNEGGQYVTPKVLENFEAIRRTLPPTSTRIEDVLTNSEIRVLKQVIKGYPSSKIADTLFIAKVTVETHLRNLKIKLNVRNKTELIIACIQYGLL
jgi:DNA-binding NarL/FixJ family response regulator